MLGQKNTKKILDFFLKVVHKKKGTSYTAAITQKPQEVPMGKVSIETRKKSTIGEEKIRGIISELCEILSEKNFMNIYNNGEILHRKRIFKPYSYFILCLKAIMQGVASFSLSHFYTLYVVEYSKEISSVGIYKAIKNIDFINSVKTICKQIINLNKHIEYAFGVDEKLKKYLRHKINIDEILGQDGTEIQVQNMCRLTMNAKSKGRPKKNGIPPKPTVKWHTTFNDEAALCKYNLTSSAEKGKGEISQSEPEKFNKSLIIADRGYMSAEHFKNIENSGNLFLIRGKIVISSEILNDNDSSLHKNIKLPKKINKIEPRRNDIYDLDVVMNNSYPCRCIKTARMNGRKKEYAVYFTNISSKLLTASQLIDLYRVRWRICEIPYKCLKSCNLFESINSNNPDLIEMFNNISMISYSLKEIYMKLMLLCYSINNDKSSYENFTCSHIKVHKFMYIRINKFLSLICDGIDAIYDQLKDFSTKFFIKLFMISPLSKRDKIKYKCITVLGEKIISQDQELCTNAA